MHFNANGFIIIFVADLIEVALLNNESKNVEEKIFCEIDVFMANQP